MPGSTAHKKARKPHAPTGTWIRPERRLAIYLRDRFRCVYCGTRPPVEKLTLDHLTGQLYHRRYPALSPHRPSNLATCCLRCNVQRKHMSLPEYLRQHHGASPVRAKRWASLIRYVRRHGLSSFDIAPARRLLEDHPWPRAVEIARRRTRG